MCQVQGHEILKIFDVMFSRSVMYQNISATKISYTNKCHIAEGRCNRIA